MIKLKIPKGQRRFIRGRKKPGDKLEYVGYIPKNGESFILANSWLLRFGGYYEVVHYDPKTKKRLTSWTLERHEYFVQKIHVNDFVLAENRYLVLRKKES